MNAQDKHGVVVYIGLWYVFNIGAWLRCSKSEPRDACLVPVQILIFHSNARLQHLQQKGIVARMYVFQLQFSILARLGKDLLSLSVGLRFVADGVWLAHLRSSLDCM